MPTRFTLQAPPVDTCNSSLLDKSLQAEASAAFLLRLLIGRLPRSARPLGFSCSPRLIFSNRFQSRAHFPAPRHNEHSYHQPTLFIHIFAPFRPSPPADARPSNVAPAHPARRLFLHPPLTGYVWHLWASGRPHGVATPTRASAGSRAICFLVPGPSRRSSRYRKHVEAGPVSPFPAADYTRGLPAQSGRSYPSTCTGPYCTSPVSGEFGSSEGPRRASCSSSVDVETTIQASLALRSDILGALPFEAVLALSKFLSPRFWVSAVGVVLTRALDGFRSFGITLDALVCTFVRHQLASLAKTDNDVIFRLQGEHFQEKGSPDLESSWNPARIQAESHARGIDLVYSAASMRCDADRFAPPAHDSEKLRLALVEWATLHIKYGVPSIMLVLSSAVMASRAQLYTEGPLLAPRCQASDTSNRIANRIGPIPKLLPVSHSSVNGFAVCLHNLLTHIPGGLDTPHRLGIAI